MWLEISSFKSSYAGQKVSLVMSSPKDSESNIGLALENISENELTFSPLQLLSKLNGIVNRDGNFTLGVLLTQAELLGLEPSQLKSYKTLIKREMFNMMDQIRGSEEEALRWIEEGIDGNVLPTPKYVRAEQNLPIDEDTTK